MASQGSFMSIADASQPNAGRIYDYLLGGNHNFEIDRVAAEQLIKSLPSMPLWVRTIRWFLGEAVSRLSREGFTKFLDFASGLPTIDHIHQTAPRGTKVIYSDIDPVTVAYAQDILKGLPNAVFVDGDASEPETVLSLDVVRSLFGSDHKAAIGFNGIAWFLPDEKVRHAMQVLYDWADRGSKLYISDTDLGIVSPVTAKVSEFYKQVKQPIFPRSRKTIESIIGNWKICEPGFLPLVDWLPIDRKAIEDVASMNQANTIGAILVKE